jgi:chemotaxis methyl-accepting protein methylase
MSELIHEFAQLIENASGFVIGGRSTEALASFAEERVARGGFAGVERYIDYLRRHPDSEEWRHILSKITIKESYLFRSHAQFEALADTILGEIAGRRADQRVRVWCAGCARGEEAATLAMVLADHPIIGTWEWSVLATDVDEAALADANRGVYGLRAVARVPAAALERHFVRCGLNYELRPELRLRIEYRRLNLVEQPLDFAGKLFDVVFLRNVLIYFRPEIQRRVIESVEGVLEPDGTVFLGPSESLIHLGTRLKARDLGDCFCYRRPLIPGDEVGKKVIGEKVVRPTPVAAVRRPVSMTQIPFVDPDPVPAFEVRLEAMINALEEGSHQRAAAGLAALRHELPESAVAHALEGVAFERLEVPEKAALAYRAALYLSPEMDEVRFLLARVLEGLGRSGAATREYRTALTGLGPAGSYLTSILNRLGFPDHDQMSEICLEKLNLK